MPPRNKFFIQCTNAAKKNKNNLKTNK